MHVYIIQIVTCCTAQWVIHKAARGTTLHMYIVVYPQCIEKPLVIDSFDWRAPSLYPPARPSSASFWIADAFIFFLNLHVAAAVEMYWGSVGGTGRAFSLRVSEKRKRIVREFGRHVLINLLLSFSLFVFVLFFVFCFFFCVRRGEREFKRLNTRKSERMEKEKRTWTSSRGCLSRLIVPLEVQVSVIYYSRPFCIRSDNEDRRAETSILISFHQKRKEEDTGLSM